MVRSSSHPRSSSFSLQKWGLYGFVALFVIYLGFIAVRSFRQSLILDKRDRINIVFYGEEAVLLSFGLADDVRYIVSFSHADKVSVPGGYGRYPVGSLGKLAELEKDPDLIYRTFASMASAQVDYYVFPKNAGVFEKLDTDTPAFIPNVFIKQLFSHAYISNLSLLDKLYMTYLISKYRVNDFVVLRSIAQENEDGGTNFSEKRFLKKYKGFFYHESLRDEAKEIKIIYSDSYASAVTLGRVIEGQGIRVVDLSEQQDDAPVQAGCLVTYSSFEESKTAVYLEKRFGCRMRKGKTEGADIILNLGQQLSETWK